MFGGLGMPLPYLSNKPGPGRPGWSAGTYDFQFEVTGAVTIKAQPAAAGTFTIKWPDKSEVTTTGGNSIAAPNGTPGIVSINKKTDTTYADQFAVVGGQTNVSRVISWGQNPWSVMQSAFSNCDNLTSISETVFIADAGCNMRSMLNNCDSLTIAKINNWDLSAGIDAYEGLIRNCDNLEELDATNLVVKFSSASGGRTMFGNNGNSVANGCLFKMSGMDFSSTTVNLTGGNSTINMFSACKFADGSDLSNWNFPATWNGGGFFNSSKIVGTNAVLNISNWDNYPGTSLSFSSMNTGMGDTGAKINLTNLNLSNFNNMTQMFYFTDLSQIIGVSTWNATAGNVNAYRAFWGSNFLSVTPTDNFSNAFIQSLTPTNVTQMFASFGNDNENVAVNLNGLDLSNITTLSSFMSGAKFSTAPDFSNITFPSTAISWASAFYGFDLPDAATSILDFSTVTAKISSLASTFSGCGVNEIKFGDNVDFSQLTSFNNTFYNPPRLNNPQFPTNANFGAVTDFYRMFYASNSKFSTCQADNFIRRLHATAFSNNGNVSLNNSQITEAPSVVRTLEAELVANGWTISESSTDATIPFEYTGSLAPNTNITPTNNTGSAFTGTFTSSNSNIPVVATGTNAGLINTPNGGSTTIRYTLADGCYTEQAIQLVSAEFSYSASAYCQNVADPTPTVTGTSGGTFSATLKVVPFKMQFEVASGTQKTISIPGVYGSSFTIDWGDGFTETSIGGDNRTISHTYNDGNNTDVTNPTVSINATGDIGPLTALRFAYSVNDVDLIDIPQWGNIQWTTMVNAFMGCTNANFTAVTATDKPDLSSCINLSAMFRTCSNLQSINNISNWDVGNITDMSLMFQNTPFNQGISSWNVSNVTNMSAMFQNSTFNQDIDSWDVSEVIDMSNMFRQNSSFNQDLNSWDVSKVENMNNMFYLASVFNGNIRNWNTGNVTNMSGMFRNASAFNEVVGSWDTSSVTNMSYIFSAAGSFNQDIGSWDVSNVTSFVNAIAASSFNNGGQSSINNWTFSTTSNINFQGLFRYANSFNQPINNWNISRATSLKDFLLGASSFNQTVTSMISTIQNTTTINSMFSGSQAQADWSQFPFQYVDTSAAYAFQSNLNFTGNVSNWQIPSNVGSMQRMMRSSGITNIDYTDSIVGWAVYIYNNGGVPTGINFTGNSKTFDGTRTSDNTSGQSYTVKYSNWPSAWTNNNAQDAFDYLIETLNWNI